MFELTKRADDQLKLIDEYADVKDLFDDEEKHIKVLEENAKSILELKGELEELEQKLSEKESFKKRKKELEKILKDQIFVEHELWLNEDSFFEGVKKSLEKEKKDFDKLLKKQNNQNYKKLTWSEHQTKAM